MKLSRRQQKATCIMEQQAKPLINRVQASGLITIDLENYGPKHDIAGFDLSDYLWQGLVLKEKDFRAAVKEHDWSKYKDKTLLVFCSTDAIIPTWAYMLVASHAEEYAEDVFQGSKAAYLEWWFKNKIEQIDTDDYVDARIVVKGCSREAVPQSAYVTLVTRLQPVVKSLMYGEPCSTVPVYKKKQA